MSVRKFVLPLLLLALTACSHSPPQRYYVLPGAGSEVPAGERHGALVGLGPVTLPAYLDRPQIVTRATDNRLDLASSHRWAEPFADSFRRALSLQLAKALPDARLLEFPWKQGLPVGKRLALDVQRFDRGADGAVVLDARWSVADGPNGANLIQRVSHLSVPQTGKADDYDTLVAAYGAAIAKLAGEIAAELAR